MKQEDASLPWLSVTGSKSGRIDMITDPFPQINKRPPVGKNGASALSGKQARASSVLLWSGRSYCGDVSGPCPAFLAGGPTS